MMDANSDKSNFPLQRIMDAVHALETGEYTPDLLRDLETDNVDMAQLVRTLTTMAHSVALRDHQLRLLRRVIPVGVALSAEKDFNRLLETLVAEAQSVTNADAGTLYLLEENTLKFVILRNNSLNLKMGGTSGNNISLPPVRMYKDDGSENRANVASYVALTHHMICIADAYEADGFDFSGTKSFDAQTGYRSKSFLAMPLINADEKVIGVLQLINAQDLKTGGVVPFADDDVLESLVLLATAALDGYIREASLRNEIAQLKIEIDETRRARQVAEITDTSYFKELQNQATQIRSKRSKNTLGR
jgi:GAF domain-containing protein